MFTLYPGHISQSQVSYIHANYMFDPKLKLLFSAGRITASIQ